MGAGDHLAQLTQDRFAAAARRIRGLAARTPLLRLESDTGAELWLKLENLQPIRSFKIRGAAAAMLARDRDVLADGVWAASAGNMAQGVAWVSRRLDVPCTVVVPEGAPEAKIAAIRELGADVVFAPFHDWFRIYETRRYAGMTGTFVHAFSDLEVMAGNGTIGLEILEDLPDVDTVVAPYGGGGLSCGIAAALRLHRPGTRVLAAEVETAAPLAAAFESGRPVDIEHTRSFVDGIGGPVLFQEMWDLASELLAGAVVSSLEEISAAIRLLVRRTSIVAEGAGAASVAAALAGRAGTGKIVCIVSGGNLDTAALSTVLEGGVPGLPEGE